MVKSLVQGVGSALPRRIMTNDDIAKVVDTSDEWIVERTGIRARHVAGEGETTRTLAVDAAKAALSSAGVNAADIDLIVLATSTPDNTFPATAALVQSDLGITQGAAFDIQAVCSGFVYGLAAADNFVKAGQSKHALVIGSETFSRILDWNDRTTCVLFGDGAGAFVISATDDSNPRGMIGTRLRADGRYNNKLYVDGGPSTTKTVGHLRMEGREVFKHAVTNISSVMAELLAEHHVQPQEVDWFVPHQANRRILEGTARKLGVSEDRIVMTLEHHGNTSAASIPLAFDAAVKDGRIKPGHLVLVEAMGGGFTWGAGLFKY